MKASCFVGGLGSRRGFVSGGPALSALMGTLPMYFHTYFLWPGELRAQFDS